MSLRHRDDHLADGLGLGAVAVLDLVELGDAVDEHRDLVAELGAQLVERVVGVFDGVVQQRRGDRSSGRCRGRRGSARRRRGWVMYGSPLWRFWPVVGAFGGRVGALDDRQVGLGMVRAHRLEQRVDGAGRLRSGEDAGHQTAQRRGRRRRGVVIT